MNPETTPSRPKLYQPFLEQMIMELESNAPQKGDWEAWKPQDAPEVLAEIDYHLLKLRSAVRSAPRGSPKIAEFSADIALFCMKMYQHYGIYPPSSSSSL